MTTARRFGAINENHDKAINSHTQVAFSTTWQQLVEIQVLTVQLSVCTF